VGGGAVVGGEPLVGRTGAAMDVGHMHVPAAADLLCSCGRRGCLQAAASARGIRNQLAPLRPAPDFFGDAGVDVAAALGRAAAAVAEALAIIGWLFDPDRAVVAGGLGMSQLFERIQDALGSDQTKVTIERHPLGEDAGLIGAAIGFGLQRRRVLAATRR
jgi:predicted NBD/HSP70 family sugar kinase